MPYLAVFKCFYLPCSIFKTFKNSKSFSCSHLSLHRQIYKPSFNRAHCFLANQNARSRELCFISWYNISHIMRFWYGPKIHSHLLPYDKLDIEFVTNEPVARSFWQYLINQLIVSSCRCLQPMITVEWEQCSPNLRLLISLVLVGFVRITGSLCLT